MLSKRVGFAAIVLVVGVLAAQAPVPTVPVTIVRVEATCPGGPQGDPTNPPDPGVQPVILVHGWNSSMSGMSAMANGIKQTLGARVAVYRFDYSATPDSWAGSPEVSMCLAEYIDLISTGSRARGGSGKVMLVGYSLGGLAIRYASAQSVHGRNIGAEMAGVITLDTPHLGSTWGGTNLARLLAELGVIMGGAKAFLPSADSDAAHCLARRVEGQSAPVECGTPPYLPANVPIHQIDGEVSITRKFSPFITLYTYYLDGDSIVDSTSQVGYPFSGVGKPVGAQLSTTAIKCNVTTDLLLQYAIESMPTAVAPLLKAIPGWSEDHAAMDDILAGTTSDEFLPILALTNLTAPCSHLNIASDPEAISAISQTLDSWIVPLWVQRLQGNPIVPGVGLAGVQLGSRESAVVAALGKPSDTFPVSTGQGPPLYYATVYEFEGLFLGFYSDPTTRRVFSIRLDDSAFNERSLIPLVRPGVGIGVSKTDLVTAMGKPASTMEHFTCPSTVGDVKTVTYSYTGIQFWVCTNSRVYLIDIP